MPSPQTSSLLPGTTGVTLREVVHVSIGGETVRVRFSNLYGTDPLVIGAAQIAQTLKGAAIVAGSGKPLTFHGQPSVSIPAGALAVSDRCPLQVCAPFRLDRQLLSAQPVRARLPSINSAMPPAITRPAMQSPAPPWKRPPR